MLLRSLAAAAGVAADEPLSPKRRRILRKRWAFGVGASLAAHVVAIVALVVDARNDIGQGGEGGELGVDLVRVNPVDEPAGPSDAPRAPDNALSTRDAEAVARPARQVGTPGRSLRVASSKPTTALDEPTKLVPPVPPVAPAPPPDPAAQAARAAYRATLRRHLHEAWRAGEVYQRIDPRGRLEGSLFTTAVQVRLRPDGSIARAELRESSGLPLLDKEALGALERLTPLPRLPGEMIDADNGWTVLCKFYLDVGMFRFAAEIRTALAEKWRPSKAYAMTADSERRTVLRFLLTPEGNLVSANVVSGAGLDLLDDNALAVAQPGLRLPAPPRSFLPKDGGPAQVFVAFLHQAGDVRVLKPREDVEDE